MVKSSTKSYHVNKNHSIINGKCPKSLKKNAEASAESQFFITSSTASASSNSTELSASINVPTLPYSSGKTFESHSQPPPKFTMTQTHRPINVPHNTPGSISLLSQDFFLKGSENRNEVNSSMKKTTGDSIEDQLALGPLTIEEYENRLRLSVSDLELVERVFYGGMSCDQLRAALWPYLFGLIKHRGRFERVCMAAADDSNSGYVFIEHKANAPRWRELHKLYHQYQSQWKSILPDQEMRFSMFRERKSLIERDVIRCDRLHPFYAEQPQNLATLTNLLMTYMMYDFDIGYVQGMSDLAGPILYVYKGDIVKAFWVFVEAMKLFRRNFEYTQKTIHFQLNCLFRLVKLTDPKLAQYLREIDCSNCFFAFRCIFCQFKRELMKSNNENDYSQVLRLWDSIWCVQRRHELLSKSKFVHTFTVANGTSINNNNNYYNSTYRRQTRNELTETEKFVLSLCLSMIRRERNKILLNQMDASEIHQHFINPHLSSSNLDSFTEDAFYIYQFLNTDCDLQLLVKGANDWDLTPDRLSSSSLESTHDDTANTYDLLRDYLIISPTSYDTSSKHNKCNVSQKSWDHFLNSSSPGSRMRD